SSKYNIKNSLLKLILAIFLINFSNVIAGAIIDFGNILMYGILGWICPSTITCFSGFTGGLLTVVDRFANDYGIFESIGWNGIDAKQAIGLAIATVYTFMLGFIFLALAGFLLVRTAGLALLLILSPFAYFGEVMPGMEKISSKWWNNIWSYTLFGPIFALMLYISGEMAKITLDVPPFTDPNLGIYAPVLTTIIANILPLLFLLAIIPITKELGLAGTDVIMKNTTGLGQNIAKYAGGATDRWLARGAQDQRQGLRGRLNRARAYLSPGALKRAWKATTSEQEHDYDVATGQYRDVRRPKVLGGKETHYKEIANRNDVARRIKDFATENGDEIVDMFKNATDIRDQQVLLKMGAAQGVSYKMAATQKDKAGIYYTEDAEGYNKFYNERINPRIGETEAAKLGEDIGDLEDKKGNKGLKNLGHYNNTTSKWETYDYNDPVNGPAHVTAHRADVLKSFKRSNALSTAKEMKASNFVNAAGNWNQVGTDTTATLLSNEWKKHIGKIKPEELEKMWDALDRKGVARTGYGAPVGSAAYNGSEEDLFKEIDDALPP
ncbi:hypothetical protein KJ854_04205, partial [Patescibacteria group bacterium]|nr:hypothetical protein [Patescibacteria group bacterium]